MSQAPELWIPNSYQPELELSEIELIQGGMGAGVSTFEMAGVVAAEGGLGVVSLTAAGIILARKLANGDENWLNTLDQIPNRQIAQKIKERYFIEGGKPKEEPYKPAPAISYRSSDMAEWLNVAGAFVQVRLAREVMERESRGDRHKTGAIGVNLLTKIEPSTPSALYGAILGNADVVLMGAGLPLQTKRLLEDLSANRPTSMELSVSGANGQKYAIDFNPQRYNPGDRKFKPPAFVPIVSSFEVAQALLGDADGVVLEGPPAGGHFVDIKDYDIGEETLKFNKAGLPYWLAGGHGSPEGMREARKLGAVGVQAGSVFTLCRESGFRPDIKQELQRLILLDDGVEVIKSSVASPTGFPFRIARLPGTLADPEVYANRDRVCDIKQLLGLVRSDDGKVIPRCQAMPEESWVKANARIFADLGIFSNKLPMSDTEKDKKQKKEKLLLLRQVGSMCLCNGLLAAIGLGQWRRGPDGQYHEEPALVTLGANINRDIRETVKEVKLPLTARKVARHLLEVA